MTLVDSSVWIDYFNGISSRETDILDDLLLTDNICIGDIILSEVLQGFRRDSDFIVAKELLLNLPLVEVASFRIAIESANNYRILRRKGITIRKTIDSLIATRCIADDLFLLHSDKDYHPFSKYLGLNCL